MFRRRKPDPSSSSVDPAVNDSIELSNGSASLFSQSLPPAPAETERSVRPLPIKEPPPSMNTPLASTATPQPGASLRSAVPASQPLASLRGTLPSLRRESERRTLMIGRGMTINGVINDAERLVVEGVIETSLISTTELVVAVNGVYRGEADTEDADIAGTVDGVITVRGSLTVRGTGKLIGTVRCRRLQVEDGGQITGQLEMLSESSPKLLNAPQVAEDPAF